ncbi:MAG: PTS sugar transporter subunit IIA [Oscillospiraceae bacterium]|nr:PTS sugar transporter subunit IIA [Oscillospiraceae bacterium]
MSEKKYIGIERDTVKDWTEAIRLCGEVLIEQGYADESFISGCLDRETEYPTGLPSAVPVAIPHCQCEGIKESSICILRLQKPVKFYRMDNSEAYVETKLIFNLAIKGSDAQLHYLQKLMAFVMDEEKMCACERGSMASMLEFASRNLS